MIHNSTGQRDTSRTRGNDSIKATQRTSPDSVNAAQHHERVIYATRTKSTGEMTQNSQLPPVHASPKGCWHNSPFLFYHLFIFYHLSSSVASPFLHRYNPRRHCRRQILRNYLSPLPAAWGLAGASLIFLHLSCS